MARDSLANIGLVHEFMIVSHLGSSFFSSVRLFLRYILSFKKLHLCVYAGLSVYVPCACSALSSQKASAPLELELWVDVSYLM